MGAELERGAKAIVRVARWHLDVDDGDVGAKALRPAQEVIRGSGLCDDLEPGSLEYPRDPLAQEYVVLADDHADRHSSKLLLERRPGEQGAKLAVWQVVLSDERRGTGRAHASRRHRIATGPR